MLGSRGFRNFATEPLRHEKAVELQKGEESSGLCGSLETIHELLSMCTGLIKAFDELQVNCKTYKLISVSIIPLFLWDNLEGEWQGYGYIF